MNEKEIKKSLATNISEEYGNQTWVRAIIQAIPYVGGSLDTLISAQGQKWRDERVQHYVRELATNISGLQEKFNELVSKSPEETYDLIRSHIEHVDRTRSEIKRKRFANILLNQVDRYSDWDEPDTATRLLRNLTDLHIILLKDICSAPICDSPYGGLRVSVIEPLAVKEKGNVTFNVLTEQFKGIAPDQLRLLVIELLSSGLIKDEGVGRFGAAAMEKFSPLPTGDWFLSWVER